MTIDNCKSAFSVFEENINDFEKTNWSRFGLGIPSCFHFIDKILGGWQDTELIVVGGRPSMGKTSFAIKVAMNSAKEGFPVLFRSIEMSRKKIMNRIISDVTRIDLTLLRTVKLDPDHWCKITEATGNLDKLPFYIDDRPYENINELQELIISFYEKHGHCLVVIDNLQYIDGFESDRKDLEIGTITHGLKQTARELNIPIIITSHLNRNLEERFDKRPQLKDLSGSAAIERDADIVFFLYRDEIYNRDENNPNKGIAELILAKNRDSIIGFVPLRFLPQFSAFENYND